MTSPKWFARAACRGMEASVFYAPVQNSGRPSNQSRIDYDEYYATAKKICESCPVRAECLNYSIENDEWNGFWGGYQVEERRGIAAKRLVPRTCGCGNVFTVPMKNSRTVLCKKCEIQNNELSADELEKLARKIGTLSKVGRGESHLIKECPCGQRFRVKKGRTSLYNFCMDCRFLSRNQRLSKWADSRDEAVGE